MLPIIASLIPIIGSVLDKIIPNAAEREKAKLEIELKLAENETELLKLFSEIDKSQIEVNQEEAKSTSLFVSGWRPFIGWVSGIGVAWAFVFKPLADWILAASGSTIITPTLNTGELMSLLLGLLGMGALRSFEKVKGVASK
jgi:hypothetical protein